MAEPYEKVTPPCPGSGKRGKKPTRWWMSSSTRKCPVCGQLFWLPGETYYRIVPTHPKTVALPA